MENPDSDKKNVYELTIDDFIAHPIWTWADDDSNLVMPVGYSQFLPEDHDALFITCEFTLNDDTRIVGALSLRTSDRQVYLLSFPKKDGRFFDFPLQPELSDFVTREQLADWLQKDPNRIFPITYKTRFAFSDGHRLCGKIE